MNKPLPPATLEVNSQNYALLRRMDADGDGRLQKAEAVAALAEAGDTRAKNEVRGFSQAERTTMISFLEDRTPVVDLVLGQERIGQGEGRLSWGDARARLAEARAGQAAPLGTVGQERVGALDNSDCGPAAALYMQDRRIRHHKGAAPARTHGEADAIIADASRDRGTLGVEMKNIMDRRFARAGDQVYQQQFESTSPQTLPDQLRAALSQDPGGVMVSIVSTRTESATSGTNHWIVVTGMVGNQVSYYDPGGSDGASHEHTMPLDELVGSLALPLTGQRALVYGRPVPEAQAQGELPLGRPVAALDTWLGERPLEVRARGGVYESLEKAEEVARQLAAGDEQDAVVREESTGFAVYAVDDVASRGVPLSDNTLVNADPAVIQLVRAR